MPDGSATAHTYRPKLATVLAEGYSLAHFRKDMLAALTVAIVALPLSMAIAVASGVSPERGLYAAVIGGFLVSAVAQGIANVASAIFGGISVTGTIARTATNIRAGAVSPVAGMMHALLVLIFMVVASPLASFIPLSALAGVLVVVCWNMAERHEFLRLLHDWRGASVLIATFGLTLIEDLTVGIIAGCVLAAAFAVFDRMRRGRADA